MEAGSQRPKGWEGTILVLNATIEALNLAKEISSITPAKAVFGSVTVILTTIKVSFLLKPDVSALVGPAPAVTIPECTRHLCVSGPVDNTR